MRNRPRHFFERAVLAALQRGEGEQRFEIPDRARAQLARALETDVRSPQASEALQAGLRLAAAFDGSMKSPSIAALIRSLMRENKDAVAILKKQRKPAVSIDAVRRFARQEDRPAPALPSIKRAPPPGSIPLRAWIDTGNTKPKGRHHGR